MSRVSSRIVATPSDGNGVMSNPYMGRRPPLEAKVARTVSNVLQRSIPPCACSTKSKSSAMGSSPYLCWPASVVQRNRTRDDYNGKLLVARPKPAKKICGLPRTLDQSSAEYYAIDVLKFE